jgi:uncharacterized protein YdiU (UPF0061 family)
MKTMSAITHLDELQFDNSFTRELPEDPETHVKPRQVLGACYSRVKPGKASNPKLIAWSKEVADLLGLGSSLCESADFTEVFSGNRLLNSMDAYASCYGGHQFGFWAGQLGDGRAINLGEVINHRNERWTLQLKGAGLTPYSRSSDGLAVLRSSVREFLCSEAMFHLGVPTTRALSLILTGDNVIRDMFYDGNPRYEPGAVVCRVAPSFTRFGSFQIFASRSDTSLLKKFMDYTLRTDFPHLGEPSPATYLAFFEEVCQRTADMIVHWQRVGFVHGVMNTDNMSVLGLTIDYGPYGWLENYDPGWTPNTTDEMDRRYRFGNQPQIAYWNLGQLANALYPLTGKAKPLQQALFRFEDYYESKSQTMIAAKLGLKSFSPATDTELNTELLSLLQAIEWDMTIFYRSLADLELNVELSDDELMQVLVKACYTPEQIDNDYKTRMANWLRCYIKRVQHSGIGEQERKILMNNTNPKYVLRNYLAQLAIDKAETGDYSLVNELLELLRHPYDEQPDKEQFSEKRPDWAKQRAGCSMLSCSS